MGVGLHLVQERDGNVSEQVRCIHEGAQVWGYGRRQVRRADGTAAWFGD